MPRLHDHFGRVRTAGRRAITLIELLVVIAILSIITAASIPLLTSGMEQRRVREAGRLVSSYISSAKARAVETGRPSGVMIQRYTPAAISAGGGALLSLPGYATSLVTVEMPSPYAGDSTSSMALLSSQWISGIYYGNGYTGATLNCGIVTSLGYGTPSGIGAAAKFPTSDVNWQGLVRQGDLIRFGNQGRWYVILGTSGNGASVVTSASSPATLHSALANPSPTGNTTISAQPSPTISGTSAAPWVVFAIDGSGAVPSAATPAGSTGTATPVAYQILRQPTKSAVPPLQLPEGVVVDLENSGVGIVDTYLGGDFNGQTGHTTMPLYPNPMITFNPTGTVGFVYTGFFQPQHLTYALYLLVGRRDGMSDVNPNNAGTYNPLANTGVDPNNLPNLYDMNNLWVAINPQSGLVVSAENANANNLTAAYPTQLTAARQFAQTAVSMGGK